MQTIEQTIQAYFQGTHSGNTAMLQKAFHPDAHITGYIGQTYYDFTLLQFIERVCEPKADHSNPNIYDKKIISIDSLHNLALAKTKVLVGQLYFIDYITLIKISGEWVIRHKAFSTE